MALPVPGGNIIGAVAALLLQLLPILVFGFVAFVVMIIAGSILRGKMLAPKLVAHVYDPTSMRFERVGLREATAGVYQAVDLKSGETKDYIVFMSPFVRLYYDKQEKKYVVPAVAWGSKLFVFEPYTAQMLQLTLDNISEEFQDVSQLIASLYARRRLPANLTITPRMKLAVYLDGARLAEILAKLKEYESESVFEAFVSMTSAKLNFKNTLAQLLEASTKQIQARSKLIMTAALALTITIAAALFIWSMFK